MVPQKSSRSPSVEDKWKESGATRLSAEWEMNLGVYHDHFFPITDAISFCVFICVSTYVYLNTHTHTHVCTPT